MKEKEQQIVEILDMLKPFLQSDGGDIEFIKYENNNVYIKLTGACSDCQMIDFTLKDGIKAALKEEIPEINEVINVTDF